MPRHMRDAIRERIVVVKDMTGGTGERNAAQKILPGSTHGHRSALLCTGRGTPQPVDERRAIGGAAVDDLRRVGYRDHTQSLARKSLVQKTGQRRANNDQTGAAGDRSRHT